MDVSMYDGASDQEDHQATQIEHDLLAPGSSPVMSMEIRNPLIKNLFADVNDGATDSQLSTRSAPQYHFHGLASTQTQSQSQPYAEDMDVEMEGGSQKENIGASKTTGKEPHQSSAPRSPSPCPSQSKDQRVKAVSGTNSPAPNNKTATKKATTVTFESPRNNGRMTASPRKAVTRQSPHKPGALTTRYKPVPRPPSRASSVDSFARDPELDNAEGRLIANTEQFNIPISELAKDLSVEDASYDSSGMPPPYPPSRGRNAPIVLAPDSQEQEDESVQHTQLLDDEEPRSLSNDVQQTQLFETEGTQPVDGYESSQPSDIAHFYSHTRQQGGSGSGDSFSGAPVVASTFQATQIDEYNDPAEEAARRLDAQSIFSAPTSVFTAATYNRPGRQIAPAAPRPRRDNPVPMQSAQESVYATAASLAETQPSFPEPSPPKRSIPPPKLPFKKAPPPIPRNVDPLDIVPDSEPPMPPPRAVVQPQQIAGPSKPAATATPLAKKKAAAKPTAAPAPVPVAQEKEDNIEESEDEAPPPPEETIVKRPRGRPPGNSKAKGKGKEKEKAVAAPEMPAPAVVEEKAPAKTLKTRSVARRGDRSDETIMVPSSVPSQDGLRSHAPPNVLPPPKVEKVLTPALKNKGKRAAAEESEHEDEPEEEDQQEEEAQTGRNKRRKRNPPESATRPTREVATIKREKRGATATPARSLRSDAARFTPSGTGTRVFALWPQDGHWYAGVVHREADGGRYLVHFDDTNSHTMQVTDMRLCNLRPDDEVLYGTLNRPARVVTVEGMRVQVEFDGKTEWQFMKDLRIPNTTIRYGWEDRTLTKEDITTTHSRHPTTTPSRPSLIDTPANGGPKLKHLMATTGFIITAPDRGEKDSIQSQVKLCGGHTLDNFPTDVIDLAGAFSDKKKQRWILSKKQAVWKGDKNTKRVFLLAEDPVLTPKYLMALALGIPCVSTAWLTDSVENDVEKDWSSYLLPQGFSPSIGARLSQQVDVDWGSSIYHLQRIMDNAVPSKPFRNMHILYILSDSICGKGQRKPTLATDENAQPSYILLGMGAETVETVPMLMYASKSLDEYDYVVVRDNCSRHAEYHDYPKVVEWPWVKECLIASRILPIPPRPSEESYEA